MIFMNSEIVRFEARACTPCNQDGDITVACAHRGAYVVDMQYVPEFWNWMVEGPWKRAWLGSMAAMDCDELAGNDYFDKRDVARADFEARCVELEDDEYLRALDNVAAECEEETARRSV